jgi:glycosyltransferase involved in cell wall biosynthesis
MSPPAQPRLLFIGQTPPPWHGQAVATKMLFDHKWEGFEVECIRMAYSSEMDEIGRLRWEKVGHLISMIRKTRSALQRMPGAVLIYPPASPHWTPFLRDFIYLLCTRQLAAKTVFLYHAGGLAEWVERSWLRRAMARLAYAKADLSLEVAVEEASPHVVFRAKRWKWSPYGIEVPKADPDARGQGGPCVVLFVGSLQEGKGVIQVLNTAARLTQRGRGADFRFRLVGRWFSSEFEQEVRQAAETLGVNEMVEFPGQLTGPDKWKAYAGADIFFFPTHYSSEAFPIVLIEALGSGLPIVTTRWRGVPSLVEDSDVASICSPRSPEDFADALEYWQQQAADARQIARRARDFYEQRYLPEHFLGRIGQELALLNREPGERPRATAELPGETSDLDSPPIRVLQVFNQYLERGGEEIWVNEMLRLCNHDRIILHDLRFHSRAWKGRGAPNRFRQARLLWDNPEARQRLREEVLRLRPQVLVFHNLIPVASLGLYAEAKLLGLPVIQFTHNFRPFSASGTLWFAGRVQDAALKGNPWPEIFHGAWEGSLLKTALLAWYFHRLRSSGTLSSIKRWITVSDFMRNKFIEAGKSAATVTTLRHCWQATKAIQPQEERDYYLFLGRLVPEKGVSVLLEAWKRLEERLGSACPRLVIAGVGPDEAKIHKMASFTRRVSCVGFVEGEEKDLLLAGCRALLAPSIWWEPLGLIVFEAYDHARPVLAARSGGMQETVLQGVTGFLHEPGNATAITDDVMLSESLGTEGRLKMGLAAHAWLLHNADPEHWRRSFEAILLETIRSNSLRQ